MKLACAVAALALSLPAHALRLVTEQNPPLNYAEGRKIVGIATETLAEMGKRAKVPMTFEIMAWDAAYTAAQGDKDTCVYATARLANRQNLFAWVGPIATNRWGLFATPSFDQPIGSIKDLRTYRIGAVTADAKGDHLKENGAINVLAVGEDKLNPPRLKLPKGDINQIDLWITSLASGRQVAADAQVDVKLVYVVADAPTWLACNPRVPKATLEALTKALGTMQKDGTLTKIAAPYDAKFKP